MNEKYVTAQQYKKMIEGPKGAGGPLDILDPIAWQGQPVPPRRWLVDGLVPEGNVTALYGNGGSGKSTLALQMLISCSLGRNWLGLNTRRCKAIGVFCEDDAEELHRRTAAIVSHHNAELGDLENLRLISRVGCINPMITYQGRYEPGETTAFFSQIMNAAIDFGAEAVVLDSLHDLYPGDENDRQQVRQFINELRLIATEIKGSVILIAHPSRAGMMTGSGDGGSTAWHNTVRSRLYMRPADPNQDGPVEQMLEHPKGNYGGKLAPIGLTWDNGAFVADTPSTGMVAHIEKGRSEKIFLRCLDALTKQGRLVSAMRNAGNYAPREMLGMPESEKLKRAELEGAMKRLFSANQIKVEHYGPPSKGWRRIVKILTH